MEGRSKAFYDGRPDRDGHSRLAGPTRCLTLRAMTTSQSIRGGRQVSREIGRKARQNGKSLLEKRVTLRREEEGRVSYGKEDFYVCS